MRDPEQIHNILDLILHIWIRCPELSVFQILEKSLDDDPQLYYRIEDGVLEAGLKRYLEGLR